VIPQGGLDLEVGSLIRPPLAPGPAMAERPWGPARVLARALAAASRGAWAGRGVVGGDTFPRAPQLALAGLQQPQPANPKSLGQVCVCVCVYARARACASERCGRESGASMVGGKRLTAALAPTPDAE
jgi:hypothetical protein